MSEIRFINRVAIVTGAGNGFGKAYAMALAARGASVVVNHLGGSRSGDGADKSPADKAVSKITAAGGTAVANHDLVTDGGRIVETAMDYFGRFDVLINKAGILRDKSFHKMSQQDWNLIYDVHVKGAFRVTHTVWPTMREQNFGRMIFTASAAGIYGNFGQSNYSTAELGLTGLAQTLSLEGKNKNILVNTVAPVAGSRLTESVMPMERLETLRPECVTPLVLKLCDKNSPETGGLLEVGGAWMDRKTSLGTEQGQPFQHQRGIFTGRRQPRWEKITDFTNADYASNIAEACQPIVSNL